MHRSRSTSGSLRLLLMFLALGGLSPRVVAASPARHGPASSAIPSHPFQWQAHAARDFQLGVHLGLVQLELGGLNVSVELRWKRLWLTYQHGMWLTVASNLDRHGVLLTGSRGSAVRTPHTFDLYPNLSVGYALDL